MKITCRPLDGWPGQLRTPRTRVNSPFRSGWDSTTQILAHEADMLRASELVIRLALADTEIRQDGWPYARSQPRHPGVVIVLPASGQGRVSFQTDRYHYWQDNARAIGLAMEALRKADRYGVSQGRQYAGFRELPSGSTDASTGVQHDPQRVDVLTAATLIINACKAASPKLTAKLVDPQSLVDDRATLHRWHRYAVQLTHPDAGGDAEAFNLVQQSFNLLQAHHDQLDAVLA